MCEKVPLMWKETYDFNWKRTMEWRRLIGCLKLQVIFRQTATNYRARLRKMTYKDKASYESSPPCTPCCLLPAVIGFFSNEWGLFVWVVPLTTNKRDHPWDKYTWKQRDLHMNTRENKRDLRMNTRQKGRTCQKGLTCANVQTLGALPPRAGGSAGCPKKGQEESETGE